MNFQIRGLESSQFAELTDLSEADLSLQGIVVEHDGGPCRITLTEVPEGGEVLLLNFCHLEGNTPFRSRGPIYIQRNASTARLEPGEVPGSLSTRVLSVRAYDKEGMMSAAKLTEGSNVREVIASMFEDVVVEFLHIHYALRGCYACRVDRA